MLICLFSSAMGLLLGLRVPLLVFAAGLILTAMVCACAAWANGATLGVVLAWTVALAVCTQVGYAVGLVVRSWLQRRRTAAVRNTSSFGSVQNRF